MRIVASATAPPPRVLREIKDKIRARIEELSGSSYWLCLNCGGINTREEDDHGQPAFCSTCKTHRFKLVQPGEAITTIETLINPEDLL